MNITIQQIGCVEHGVYVEDILGENDRPVGATHVKGLLNRRGVINLLPLMSKRFGVQSTCCALVVDPGCHQSDPEGKKPQIHGGLRRLCVESSWAK